MITFESLWSKFAKGKRYREEFVASQVKRGIPFQIRALMKHYELSQEELACRAGLSQGVVSRAANPNYGNLTINTLIRVAAGFDVAFVGKFVPFSELGRWYADLSEEAAGLVPAFDQEQRNMLKREQMERGALAAGRLAPLDLSRASTGVSVQMISPGHEESSSIRKPQERAGSLQSAISESGA